MFGWVVTFLIVALIAGILGFGGVAGASIEITAPRRFSSSRWCCS